VVAQSLVTSNKQVTGPIHYNLRVVECTLAAQVLAKIFRLKKPLPTDASPLGSSLRGFHDTYYEQAENISDNTNSGPEKFQTQLKSLIEMTENYLPQEEGYTREQIADLLGISIDELNEKYTTKVPVRAERFMIRQRALHVFGEALRVQHFMNLLNSKDEDPKQLAKKLGGLLNDVQESCRDLYECSCPELDQLCDIARGAGAYGSRLTGAGWGGCSVHLVPSDKVEAVKNAWKTKYYDIKFPKMTEQELEEAIVVSKPGRGSLTWEVAGRSSV
jgi:galactokinase